jgi:hypothetical protein
MEGRNGRIEGGGFGVGAWLATRIASGRLCGSAHQVLLARQFAIGMAKDRTPSLDDLIFDLRQSLRSELELKAISERVIFSGTSTREQVGLTTHGVKLKAWQS